MITERAAVILGAGVNGLGVARSLARARVPAWLLDTDRRRPEMYTRAAQALEIDALHGLALVDDLERLAGTMFRDSRPLLLMTREDTVRTVSHYRERLARHYRFALPSIDVVDALQHKHAFQALAERFDAPIPPLVRVRTLADLPALKRLRYPVVVKPDGRDTAYARQFKKAYRVDDAARATDLVHCMLSVAPDVVVQEWIEGPDSDICFCLQYLDREGRPVASFTGRKIRSWPPQTGGTASCVAAAEAHAELSRKTTRFFRAAGVVGMASMEYKRDARSGEFRMVEPTIGRTDYQEEVATLNGVNIPYAAWCTEFDMPYSMPIRQPRVRSWRVRSADLQSAAAQHQRVAPGMAGIGRTSEACWRWSDPLPSMVQGWRHVRRVVGARTARMMSKLPATGDESR